MTSSGKTNTMFFFLVVASLFINCHGEHFRRQARNDTVRVVTMEIEPFVTVTEDGQYEGYVPDLMKKIAEFVGIESYELYIVRDGKCGAKNLDGRWDGMIGDLSSHEADMALGPMSITSMRERVVKFSYPFMKSGITTLYRKPSSDSMPPYSSISKLAHTDIPVGLYGEATKYFFEISKVDSYKRIWTKYVNGYPLNGVSSHQEGMEKVRAGNFVLIGESPTLEYAALTDCDVMMIGPSLDQTGYGVAFPQTSPYLDRVNLAILEFQEKGMLEKLHQKWWHDRGHCGPISACTCPPQ